MPFQKKPGLRDENVLKRIYELRNQGQGFNNISKIISQEFEMDVTHPTCKNLYYEYAATQKIKSETGEQTDEEWDKHLKEKFERIERITNSLLDAVENIKSRLTPEMYLKHAPTIISILRESLNQLMFIRREQEQITVKQQNLIYSPLQILSQINQIEEKKKKDKQVIELVDNKLKEVKMVEEERQEEEDEELEDDEE
jgi:hypothetical protein